MKRFLILGSIAISALVGCTQPSGTGGEAPLPASAATPPEATSEGAPSKARGIVVAKVQTHDAKVSILAHGGGELRVVVRKTDGTLVADGVTVDELRAKDPLLHTIVTSAVAQNGTYLDASR